ncbi:MAG: sugar nucleotide-binding protein [Coprococcus sp.]
MKPDVVVHCAAWTAVDLAEDEDKIEKCTPSMWTAQNILQQVCKELDCKMIYYKYGLCV